MQSLDLDVLENALAWQREGCRAWLVTVAQTFGANGRRGHPVGFSPALFADLAALDGDEGARSVIERHRAWLEVVRVDDPGIFVDVDTPGDLAGSAFTKG